MGKNETWYPVRSLFVDYIVLKWLKNIKLKEIFPRVRDSQSFQNGDVKVTRFWYITSLCGPIYCNTDLHLSPYWRFQLYFSNKFQLSDSYVPFRFRLTLWRLTTYIHIYIHRTAQHFEYLLNKYTYWIF